MMLQRMTVRDIRRAASSIVMVAAFPLSPLMGLDTTVCLGRGSLALEISPDKTEFLLGEPIWIDVTLRNTGSDTLMIPHRIQSPDRGNLEFLVTTDGDTLDYSGPMGSYVRQPQALEPGGGITRQHDILESYGRPVDGTKMLERQISPGEYTVQAKAFVNVVSNALDITVVEPSGTEAELHSALHEAYLLVAQRRTHEAVDLLGPLLADAAHSAYRDKLYFTLILVGRDDLSEWEGLTRGFVTNYPDSRYSRPCLLRLFRDMSRSQAESFVRELEFNAPGTRAALESRKILQKYEFRTQ